MFADTLFDRRNTDKQPDIEFTLFERTDRRSLDATWKTRVLLPSHERMLPNNITVHGVSPQFNLKPLCLHKFNQTVLYYRFKL